MRFSVLSTVAILAQLSIANPIASLEKRAAYDDVATTGYATLNGGTTGGKGGATVTVTTLADLTAAVKDNTAKIVLVKGQITGKGKIAVGSNKSIIGIGGGRLTGVGLSIIRVKNVIVRNLKIDSVLASNDNIAIQVATNVWVDHVDLYSAPTTNWDLYDGALDVTHAGDLITVSNSYIHDHHKAVLIGHSDGNKAEDTGKFRITFHNNHWARWSERGPSVRFGTIHVYNNYYDTGLYGVNSRMGAQALVESNVFVNVPKPITWLYSSETGYANAYDNDLGGFAQDVAVGTYTPDKVPYKYTLLGSANVKAAVVGKAGATLGW